MKDYVKPIVLANEELAEGVYAASGVAGSGSGCYKVEAHITQRPETGRENYCIQGDAVHNTVELDLHHSGEQILTLYFNQAVTFDWCSSANAQSHSGDGTPTLQIKYNWHAESRDERHGLGDIYVKSADGLEVTGAQMDCNYDCGDEGHKPWH